MGDNTPLIRWAGSKRSSLSKLVRFTEGWPTTRYIEPFCGSAALHFHLGCRKAILADINHHLINFYQALRVQPADVYWRAVNIPRTKRSYYRARKEFNTTTEPLTKASLFYYLNKNCFNGLFRTSKVGDFNVPFSQKRIGEYPSVEVFLKSASLLKSAKIVCADFETVLLRNARAGDLVFLDPPYSTAKRYPFREYFPGCFAEADIERLINVLNVLDDRGAHFILTFSQDLDQLYSFRGWHTYSVRTRRNISGFASHRKFVQDIVVTNRRAVQ
jgi:DNA adenine methylase